MEENTELYVISDGKRYMCKDKLGRWSITNDINRADKFTHTKAQNVLINAFNSKKKQMLKIEKIVKSIIANVKNNIPEQYDWLNNYYNEVCSMNPKIKSRKVNYLINYQILILN
jgi:Tfp pilus assembly PilM family ATPase